MRGAPWFNLLALLVVNLLWAAQYPAYKIASNHMGAAALNFWMLICALILLVPLQWRDLRRRRSRQSPLSARSLREFLILGLLGIVPPSVMLAWGISRSSASNGAILSLTIPVLMTALGVVMLGERLTRLRIACLVFGLLGTLLISSNDLAHASFSRSLLVGNFIILAGCAGSAFYNTYSKELLSRYSELEVLIYSYSVAAVACAAISFFVDARPFYYVTGYSEGTWVAVVVLGAVSWGLAMVLWMWVLNRLEVGQVSASIYLLPLFGLLLSVLVVHETILLQQIVGGAITLAGTAALMFFENSGTQTSS